MFVPNTFLIGAQKSGTTYLASRLDQSPDVSVCDPKEPQFFSKHFDSAGAEYASSFADQKAKVTLDASTTYTFLRPQHAMESPDAPGLLAPVPERIRTACPNPRFIYIMRDPVARAVSAFKHSVRHMKTPPSGSLSLMEAFRRDPMLVLIGRYGDQIERYFESFACETFLFLKFEEMIADPDPTIRRVAAFLDIDPEPILQSPEEGETHAAHSLSGPGRILAQAPGVKRGLKKLLPKGMQSTLSAQLLRRPVPPMTFHDTETAAGCFAADREKVRKLTGLEV